MKNSTYKRPVWYNLTGEFLCNGRLIRLENKPARIELQEAESPVHIFDRFYTWDSHGTAITVHAVRIESIE